MIPLCSAIGLTWAAILAMPVASNTYLEVRRDAEAKILVKVTRDARGAEVLAWRAESGPIVIVCRERIAEGTEASQNP